MGKDLKRYRTQWAAQFFTAAELTRRGYITTFTLGNAPEIDLIVISPSGKHFKVDVKGLSSKNFWLIRECEPQDDLFYILVYLPPDMQAPEIFIFTSKEIMNAIGELKTKTLLSGKNWVESGSGINWKTAFDYKNHWGSLPG